MAVVNRGVKQDVLMIVKLTAKADVLMIVTENVLVAV